MKVKALVTQSCLTLCNPMNGSQPGSSVHGILQIRIQGLNLGPLHCRQILYCLSHQGSPKSTKKKFKLPAMVYQVLPGLTPDYLSNLMFGYFPYIPTMAKVPMP